MKRPEATNLCVVLPDIHYPYQEESAMKAVYQFLDSNRKKIKKLVLLGDNMDCNNISRHTEGKPRLRTRGGIKKDFDDFDKVILRELEKNIEPLTSKIIFEGNHEAWIEQWLDKNPEFEGMVEFDKVLNLKNRGWDVVPQGGFRQVGKAYLIHGDEVGGGIYAAKKLVESFCATVVMGHVHTASMHTKVSQVKAKDKWIGYTLPTLGTLSPKYAKGRPNAFVHGFGIIEVWPNGFVNVYIPIILEGRFSFAGELYGG
jgi:UDP-2,3-diacylglucosamine pyrophosphatase LpxH